MTAKPLETGLHGYHPPLYIMGSGYTYCYLIALTSHRYSAS